MDDDVAAAPRNAERLHRQQATRRQFEGCRLSQPRVARQACRGATLARARHLLRAGKRIGEQGAAQHVGRCLDDQRASIATLDVRLFKARIAGERIAEHVDDPKPVLCGRDRSGNADEAFVGIGATDVDDASVGSQQSTGLDDTRCIAHPAARYIDRRAGANGHRAERR